MLNALREGTKTSYALKALLFGMMGLGLGGLVFMDIGGYFSSGLGNTTVARIGDERVDIYEFNKLAERSVRSQNMTMGDAYRYGFINMLLQGMVGQRLLDQAANDLDIAISKKQVEETIGRVLDSYAQDGETRADVLQKLLAAQSVSEADLIDEAKSELRRSLIRNAFKASVLLIPDDAATALKTFQAEQRDLEAFKITADSIKSKRQPTPEDLQEYYDQNKAEYSIPEKRAVKFVRMSPDLFTDVEKPTEEALRADYEARIEEFKVPERRFLEQVIAPDAATAEKVLQAAKSGGLKKAAASVVKDDNAFRPETYFEKDGLLATLSEPVFNAEAGDFVGPVQSPLGWHVLRVNRIEAPRTQDFDEVRKDLEREAVQDATDNHLMELLDKVEAAITSGDSLDQIAQENKLEVTTIDSIPNDVMAATQALLPYNITYSEDLMATIFGADTGVVSDTVELDDNSFALFEVTGVVDPSYLSLKDVEKVLTAAWVRKAQAEDLRDAARDAALALNAGSDETIDAVAAKFGVKVERYTAVGREDAAPGILDDAALNTIFGTTLMNYSSYQPAGEDYIVFRTVKAYYPEELNKEPLSVQKLQMTSTMESAVSEMYFGYLRTNSKVMINQNLLDRMYKRDEAGETGEM